MTVETTPNNGFIDLSMEKSGVKVKFSNKRAHLRVLALKQPRGDLGGGGQEICLTAMTFHPFSP